MILWIDPWILKLGYAVIQSDLTVVEAWIIKMDKAKTSRQNQYERMLEIYDFFSKLLKKNKTIKKVCIEKYFFTHINRSNAEFVYGIRWALMMLCVKKWIEIKEFTPIEMKKRITWNWNAGKELVKKFVMKYYKLKDLPEYHDASDALGLAFLGRN